MMNPGAVRLSRATLDAVVFDLDGVLTLTASVHEAAWKETFDAFLASREPADGEDHRPCTPEDYDAHIDGKPRHDGVRAFLASRGIALPDGPGEGPTVASLAEDKNRLYRQRIEADGVPLDPVADALLASLRDAGFQIGVVTSSRNGRDIMHKAGLLDRVDLLLDGNDLADAGVAGKPAPDMFLAAAERLGVPPDRAAVVEDAESGVEAGRRGRFGLVVGIDRTGHEGALRDHGADTVAHDLTGLVVVGPRAAAELPSAAEHIDAIASAAPAVFLDYDGTLTPIVRRPELAVMGPDMRAAVARLAERCPVAIISGRDRADVEKMVELEGLTYAGSHGFDIRSADGTEHQMGGEHSNGLTAARDAIDAAIVELPGAWIEAKQHSFAVHYRETPDEHVPAVRQAVEGVVSAAPDLRITHGKKVFEVQPDIAWDKGRAVRWLIEKLGLKGRTPVYIGDDVTDEDAFRALHDDGIGILVRDGDRPTWAHYAVDSTDEVQALFDTWVEHMEAAA